MQLRRIKRKRIVSSLVAATPESHASSGKRSRRATTSTSRKRFILSVWQRRLDRLQMSPRLRSDLILYTPYQAVHPGTVLYASLYMALFCHLHEEGSHLLLTSAAQTLLATQLSRVMGPELTRHLLEGTAFLDAMKRYKKELILCKSTLGSQSDSCARSVIQLVLPLLEQRSGSIDDLLSIETEIRNQVQRDSCYMDVFQKLQPIYMPMGRSININQMCVDLLSGTRQVAACLDDWETIEGVISFWYPEKVRNLANYFQMGMSRSSEAPECCLLAPLYVLGLRSFLKTYRIQDSPFRPPPDPTDIQKALHAVLIRDCVQLVLDYVYEIQAPFRIERFVSNKNYNIQTIIPNGCFFIFLEEFSRSNFEHPTRIVYTMSSRFRGHSSSDQE